MCELRVEVLNVLLEAAIVFIAMSMGARFLSHGARGSESKRGTKFRNKAVIESVPNIPPVVDHPPQPTQNKPGVLTAEPAPSLRPRYGRLAAQVPKDALSRMERMKMSDNSGCNPSNNQWRTSITSSSSAEAQQQRRRRLLQFASVNSLDDSCMQVLRRLSDEQLSWVLDQHFVIGGDGSSVSEVVINLAKDASEKDAFFWASYPTDADVQKRLAEYIAINDLDKMCEKMLSGLSVMHMRKVMDHEFIVQVDSSRGTASAKVVGHILRFRKELQTRPDA